MTQSNSWGWRAFATFSEISMAIAVFAILILVAGCESEDNDWNELVPPAEPKLVAPENGAKDVSIPVELAWTASQITGADRSQVVYDVYLGKDSTSLNLLVSDFKSPTGSDTVIFQSTKYEASTTYYWKVVAKFKLAETGSEIWKFTTAKNLPPGGFELISPCNESGVSLTPPFRWKRSTDPDGQEVVYNVYLGTYSENGRQPAYCIKPNLAETTCSYTERSLAFDTKYYWYVEAVDPSGMSRTSNTCEFTTKANTAPNEFDLVSPPNNSTNQEPKPQLRWRKATDPEGHRVVYDVYLGVDTLQCIKTGLSDTTYQVEGTLALNTTYRWYVIARDEMGATRQSRQTWNFTTKQNQPPTNFDLVTPCSPPNPVDPDNVTFRWRRSSDTDTPPVRYTLYLDLTDPPQVCIAYGLQDTTFRYSRGLVGDTTYYWYVEARDALGATTASSDTCSFETRRDLLLAAESPVVLRPMIGAIRVPSKGIELAWRPPSAAGGEQLDYDIYLGTNPNDLSCIYRGCRDTKVHTGNLENGRVYYWRVVARDRSGKVYSSETWQFSTIEEDQIDR